jgi:hypothetical protein
MATIVLSDEAPTDEGTLNFSLANAEFEAPFETNDPVVLAGAEAHPWLSVEYPESAVVEGSFREPHVPAAEDSQSAQNSIANDPEAVAAALAEVDLTETGRLAVEAGLVQDTPQRVGNVATTLAADEADEDADDEEDDR